MASKTEQFLAIPGFSKLWLMHPASPAIPIRSLFFGGAAWDVKALPSGFIKGVPSSITVWIARQDPGHYAASRISASIEILDDTWERTVFHDERVGGGYASLMVKRSELEITSCVQNDNIPMRCTLTWCVDTKKQDKAPTARSRSKWWRHLRISVSMLARLKMSNSNLPEKATMTMPADVLPDRPPPTIHHLITIPGYSKLAQMPNASSLTLRRFPFLGHTWSIMLNPNASNGTSADQISIMTMIHSDSGSAYSGIHISIEILDKSHKNALFYKNQMLGSDNRWFSSTLMINKTELAAAACLDEDSFTIACTLTFLSAKQRQQDTDIITTTPSTTDESDSVCSPLLSKKKL